MRILVCGGRDYQDRESLFYTLTHLDQGDFREFEIISGMARGADSLAVDFAKTYDLPLHEFPANWDKHGRSAGAIRNQQMLDDGRPDLVVAFPGGKGTAHMVSIARKKGVKVIEVQ